MRLRKEQKEKIKEYIKLQHRKPHKWLQEHIVKRFNVEINLNTIRTWKRNMGCLTERTQLTSLWTDCIRHNFKTLTDDKLAEKISNILVSIL